MVRFSGGNRGNQGAQPSVSVDSAFCPLFLCVFEPSIDKTDGMWIGYSYCLLRTIVQTSSPAEDRFTNKKLGIIWLYLKIALYLQK